MDKQVNNKKKNKWLIFGVIILLLQVIASVVAIGEVYLLNMLPNALFAIVIGCFVFLLLLDGMMILLKGRKGKLLYVRRGVGTFICISMIAAGSMMAFYVGTLNRTVSAISTDSKVSNVIAIYVQAEDVAKGIRLVDNYTFGITEEYDYDNTKKTLEAVETLLGKAVKTSSYKSVDDMVDALYRKEVGAIVLNKAYVSLLTEEEKYANFEEQMRVLYEYEIVEEKEEPEKKLQPVQTVEEGITEKPFMIYVSGSDTRSLSLQTSRSDVNLIAAVNPKSKQVLLINTPRDYYINTAKAPGQMDKLTHCGIYGIDCSMATLGDLYQEQIDYYMQINFEGFREFTTAIGGVTVYNEKSFVSYKDNYSYPVGQVLLSGDYALSYVRERKSFADGDNQRGRNQMKVVKAIIEKLRNSNTLLTNYTDILASLEGMFVTNMTSTEMSELVKMQLSDMAEWNVNSYSVNGTGASRTTYTIPSKRSYVTVPDMATVAKAQELIDKLYAGETLTEADLELTTRN